MGATREFRAGETTGMRSASFHFDFYVDSYAEIENEVGRRLAEFGVPSSSRFYFTADVTEENVGTPTRESPVSQVRVGWHVIVNGETRA